MYNRYRKTSGMIFLEINDSEILLALMNALYHALNYNYFNGIISFSTLLVFRFGCDSFKPRLDDQFNAKIFMYIIYFDHVNTAANIS